MARGKRFTAPPTRKTSLGGEIVALFLFIFLVHVSFERRSSKGKKSYILPEPGEVLNCSMLITTRWIVMLIPAQYCSDIAPILSKLLRFVVKTHTKKSIKFFVLNWITCFCCVVNTLCIYGLFPKKCFTLDLTYILDKKVLCKKRDVSLANKACQKNSFYFME